MKITGELCTQTLLPETLWVHSYAQDAFALFLQFSRDKMDDHVEEGSVEEEEDEGSSSSFFARGWQFFMSDVVGFFVIVQFCMH